MRVRHRVARNADPGTKSSNGGGPDDDLEARLIWILGSPRTGSTWLLRLLIHPLLMDASDVGFRGPRRVRGAHDGSIVPLNEPYVPLHLTPVSLPAFREGQEPSEFLLNTRRAGDASYFFSDEYEAVWRPEVRRMVLNRFRAQVDRGAERYGLRDALVAVKEPNGSHGAELLMSLFPRSRMIFLMRDGRDVVESLVAAQTPGGWRSELRPPLTGDLRRRRFVMVSSRLWVNYMNAVQNAYEAHPGELRYRLRYEDLLAAPVPALQGIFEWLGVERQTLEIERAIEAAEAGKRAAQPGLWRESLSDREQRLMINVMRSKLTELGYSAER